MSKQDIVKELRNELEILDVKIAEFRAERDVISKMIQKRESGKDKRVSLSLGTVPTKSDMLVRPQPMKLTEAITHIFNDLPARERPAMEVRDELKRMKQRGEFESKVKVEQLLPVVHQTLKTLAERGILTKRKVGKSTLYRKA